MCYEHTLLCIYFYLMTQLGVVIGFQAITTPFLYCFILRRVCDIHALSCIDRNIYIRKLRQIGNFKNTYASIMYIELLNVYTINFFGNLGLFFRISAFDIRAKRSSSNFPLMLSSYMRLKRVSSSLSRASNLFNSFCLFWLSFCTVIWSLLQRLCIPSNKYIIKIQVRRFNYVKKGENS